MTEIEVKGLTKVYRIGDVDVHALRGVDLKIESGEFVAIITTKSTAKVVGNPLVIFHEKAAKTGYQKPDDEPC